MSEIKVRAWHPHHKRMIFGPTDGGEVNAGWVLTMCQAHDMKPMLSIGQRDKNGKNIYDLDIVRDEYGRTFIVTYSDHFLRWLLEPLNALAKDCYLQDVDMFSWTYPKMTLEVIGNIYEKAELAEVLQG